MIKKILLPISAIAMAALVACAGSEKKQAEPQVSAVQPAATVNAEQPAATVNAEPPVAPIAETIQPTAPVAEEFVPIIVPDDTTFGNCTLQKLEDDLIQMEVSIPDTAKIILAITLENNFVYLKMNEFISDKASEDYVARECSSGHDKDFQEVTCDGRHISASAPMGDNSIPFLYPFISASFYRICQQTNETGKFFLKDFGKTLKNQITSQKDPSKSCNIDMNSNQWIIVDGDKKTTVTFGENKVTFDQVLTLDMATDKICQNAIRLASLQKDLPMKYRCEGATLTVSTTNVHEDPNKEQMYQNFMENQCK